MKRAFCNLRGIAGKPAGSPVAGSPAAGKRVLLIAAVCCSLISALWGCDAAGSAASSAPGYFDLEALVEEQIALLSAEKPEVEKYLAFDGQRDTVFTREINWKDDLAFFFQAGINKPALNGIYSVTKPDSVTELYELTKDGAFQVRSVKVKYSADTGEVDDVELNSVVEGLLFDTQRILKLKLNGEKGSNRLVSYEIKGEQQLKLGKKKSFEITGLVR